MQRLLLLTAAAAFAMPAFAAGLAIQANQPLEFVPIQTSRVQVPAISQKAGPMLPEDSIEWFDSWSADGGGPMWYTPEDYEFCAGDTLELVVFANFSCDIGLSHDLQRIDAFYLCGTTNPMGFVMTSGVVDFGPLPPNDPNYGWITGVGYILGDNLPLVCIDWASRLMWGDATADCGIPLAGRPDCFCLVDCP
jgi:hypothetical protein